MQTFKVCGDSFWYRDTTSKDVAYLSPIFAVVSVLKAHSKELKGSEIVNMKSASYEQDNLDLAVGFMKDDPASHESLKDWLKILRGTQEVTKNIDAAVPILRKAFRMIPNTERQGVLSSMSLVIHHADDCLENALLGGAKNDFPFVFTEMQKVFIEHESEAHMRYMDLRDHFLTPEGQAQLEKFDRDGEMVSAKQTIEMERLAVWSELRKASVVSSSRKSVADALSILGVVGC